MAMDMRCPKFECRIELFKGETYAPYNSCPGCMTSSTPGYFGPPAPPVATPVYVPSAPTPAMIEEAVKEDVSQILTTIRNTLELRAYDAKNDGESEYARGFFHSRNIIDMEIAKYGND